MFAKLSYIVALMLILLTGSIAGAQENPEAIVDKAYKAVKLAGAESISTMTILDSKGRKRIRKIAQVSKLYENGKTEKSLVRFLSPADVKGTGFLTFDYEEKDDDMWLFMPALRKTRRIISNEKSKSFMGSEFSYSDMSPPNLNDFTYTLLGTEDAAGEKCWKIEMKPKNKKIIDENGFSKKIILISQKDNVTRKAIYYDSDGRLHKEMNVLEIRELDTRNHKYSLIHMVMENRQNGRKSMVVIEKISFSPDIGDKYFTTRYLERP